MSTPSIAVEELRRRYLVDAHFHAAVHIYAKLHGNGFTDDDGVRHTGPTVGDVMRTADLLDALEKVGWKPPGTP